MELGCSTMTDEIIEEIHAARKKIAEECGYDFKKLVERYKRMQAESSGEFVREVPKSDPEPAPTE
jgi:hypothetical protein